MKLKKAVGILLLFCIALLCIPASGEDACALKNGYTVITVTNISRYGYSLSVDLRFRNNGQSKESLQSSYAVSGWQNGLQLTQEDRRSESLNDTAKNGATVTAKLALILKDEESPVEIRIEPLSLADTSSLTILFDPASGNWGREQPAAQPETPTQVPEPVRTETPGTNTDDPDVPDASMSGYNFMNNYVVFDQAAKSVFYVEIFDSNDNFLGNASGFVAFDEHLFITNQHVINEASYLKIWDDNDDYICRLNQVVASDKAHDVAILLFPEGEKYPSLELEPDKELKRGQPVVTIGSPEGYANTVAYGNISALPVMPKYGNIRCIQITAPVSHGSSGGCLLDDQGKVIGITSSISVEGQNINFAVPIHTVCTLYGQWDGASYEPLGSAESWDTVSYVTPVPRETPAAAEMPDERTLENGSRSGNVTLLRTGRKASITASDLFNFNDEVYIRLRVENHTDRKIAEFRIDLVCYAEDGQMLSSPEPKSVSTRQTLAAGGFDLTRWIGVRLPEGTASMQASLTEVTYEDGTVDYTALDLGTIRFEMGR